MKFGSRRWVRWKELRGRRREEITDGESWKVLGKIGGRRRWRKSSLVVWRVEDPTTTKTTR